MHLQSEADRMLARALYEAGQADREIADGCNTSVNNVIWWRRESGLKANIAAGDEVDAASRFYSDTTRMGAGGRKRPDTPADFGMEPIRRPKAPAAGGLAPVLGILTAAEAHAAYVAPVQPTGDSALEIGTHAGSKVFVDLEELLTTRLLIQGNSGSGKTHLLRRILEECAGIVQQVIIDPEGDFASFGETFGHTVVEASKHSRGKLAGIAGKAREHRASVVLTLDGMDINEQMEAATAFLGGLFDAGPDHWHPVLVAVDEAHLFAPAQDNGEDKETRKGSQHAMGDLMCRGRKRGLAGIIATQRLSKLHKNVAAEASNFLMGRTFLDIDIARAADLLGMSRADSEQVRNLIRGEFLGLGPAIARRPLKVKVATVITQGKAGIEKGITPLPSLTPEDMQSLLLADDDDAEDATVVPFARKA